MKSLKIISVGYSSLNSEGKHEFRNVNQLEHLPSHLREKYLTDINRILDELEIIRDKYQLENEIKELEEHLADAKKRQMNL